MENTPHTRLLVGQDGRWAAHERPRLTRSFGGITASPSPGRPEPCQDRGPTSPSVSCPRPLGGLGGPPCATLEGPRGSSPVLPVEGRGLEQRACLQERDTCKVAGPGGLGERLGGAWGAAPEPCWLRHPQPTGIPHLSSEIRMSKPLGREARSGLSVRAHR